MERPSNNGFAEWFRSLPPWASLGSLFSIVAVVIVVLVAAPENWGVEQQETEELHTVTNIAFNFKKHRGSWIIRTRDEIGKKTDFGVLEHEAARCEIGQKIVVVRQGTNTRLNDEACERKVLFDAS